MLLLSVAAFNWSAGYAFAGAEIDHAEGLERGKLGFATHCAGCHGQDGEGLVGPELRAVTENARGLVRIMLNGTGSMPTVVGVDTPASDIRDLTNFIRNSWGNNFGYVTVEDIENYLKPAEF